MTAVVLQRVRWLQPLGPGFRLGFDAKRRTRDKELALVDVGLDPGLRRERVNGVHASSWARAVGVAALAIARAFAA